MMERTIESPRTLHIRVDCATGHRGEKVPARLYFGTRAIDCLEIIDRWHGKDHRYFKVRAGEGELYIVRFDIHAQEWDLTLYSREQYLAGQAPGPSSVHPTQ